jgi:pimeloyl-ACP methyl ester carboxylesterase
MVAVSSLSIFAFFSDSDVCVICRYGWRYQIGPWMRAGYRVVVPDMLGYGGTDKPQAAEEYSTKRLCADLAALLDVIGVLKAVSKCPPGNWDHTRRAE